MMLLAFIAIWLGCCVSVVVGFKIGKEVSQEKPDVMPKPYGGRY